MKAYEDPPPRPEAMEGERCRMSEVTGVRSSESQDTQNPIVLPAYRSTFQPSFGLCGTSIRDFPPESYSQHDDLNSSLKSSVEMSHGCGFFPHSLCTPAKAARCWLNASPCMVEGLVCPDATIVIPRSEDQVNESRWSPEVTSPQKTPVLLPARLPLRATSRPSLW